MNDEQAAQLKGFRSTIPWTHLAGLAVLLVDSTVPVFALAAERRHCNTYNIVHGGLMMTLIDLTMVVCQGAPHRAVRHSVAQFGMLGLGQRGRHALCAW